MVATRASGLNPRALGENARATKSNPRLVNNAEWLAAHAEYLRSPEWRAKRRQVLERDRWICQAGLRSCDVAATEVHHITYRHWRNEPLFELMSVCTPCHEEITRMDRAGAS